MSMYPFTIIKFSHHFSVNDFEKVVKACITSYILQFATYEFRPKWGGGYERVVKEIYAVAVGNRKEYRLPINLLDDFLKYMDIRGFTPLKILEAPMYTSVSVSYDPNPVYVLRDYQGPIVEHILLIGNTKLITLQPGKGKTLCSLYAVSKLGVRLGIIIKPMYIQRWLDDLCGEKSFMRLSQDEVFIVKGMKGIVDLLDFIRDGVDIKVIIFSNRTLAMFYDTYQALNGDYETLGLHPVSLFQVLGLGAIINDEMHQDFHANFSQYMYTHVPLAIALSGTMETENTLLNRIYSVLFPKEVRKDAGFVDKYISVRACMYGLSSLGQNTVKYLQRGRGSYSHIEFEKSILKIPALKKQYMAMIYKIIKTQYIDKREPGFRCLIFAALVKTCEEIKAYISKLHPELNIVKYTSGDSYTKLKECDIGVSTIGSAGTAIDVKGLVFCLSTTSMDKLETNQQALLRMRKMEDRPDIVPMFYYMVCRDISKHVTYHEHKKKIFENQVLSHSTIELGENL